ncbi:hypothetical protein MPH_08999 [Macrophomina phaseolina MS6]|uniref:Uncharacterized protein n=1 Tax=Macrophomina phaseolina (strain MS6) TaxID=1126212 RepID=K2RGU5_MACPH|nr:hypothetical protein MPH_08999 [Macrophomina phaseolina MS6]
MMQDHGEAFFILEATDPKVYYALRALRDWQSDIFEDRMLPEIHSQLEKQEQIFDDTWAVIHGTKGRDENAVKLAEKLEQGNEFGIDLVLSEGRRMLDEMFQYISHMDDDRSFFLVDPPTEFPWE